VCPAWTFHSESFRRFLRSWGIGGENNIYELLTGVLPGVTLWRSWQSDDEVDHWGISCLSEPGAAGRVPAVAIVPSTTRDCLVDQLDVIAYPTAGITNACIAGQGVFIYTPQQGYNPIPPANITLAPQPGLVNSRQFALPQTVFICGWNAALPPNTAFKPWTFILDSIYNPGFNTFWPAAFCTLTPGPADPNCPNPPFAAKEVPNGVITLAGQAAFEVAKSNRIWSNQGPPMRVPSAQSMVVQLDVVPSVSYSLLVNVLFREQSSEEI